jgi:hypothetical protein
MIISWLLYFSLAGLSILGLGITGFLIERKERKTKPYLIPEPKILYIIGILVLFYVAALGVEFSGHILGLWTWSNPYLIFLHAAYWWTTMLTLSVLYISTLKPIFRFCISFLWIFLFECLQQAFIQFVNYFPLFGNPYLMIFFAMLAVSSSTFIGLNILFKLKLLKKD